MWASELALEVKTLAAKHDFCPWNPHSGGRVYSEACPLTSIHAACHMHAHVHTHTRNKRINVFFFKKEGPNGTNKIKCQLSGTPWREDINSSLPWII